jgi:hypothetical protein
MSKVDLTTIENLEDQTGAADAINSNFGSIQEAFENTLSRDGTEPNIMAADLDMDSNHILNLPTPTTATEPATKGYVDGISALSDAAALQTAVDAAEASADAAAASAVTSAEQAEALTATSLTTLTPSVASKVFQLEETLRAFIVGAYVLARSDANPTTVWMHGQVTDYTGDDLTVDVQSIGTATESSDWTIQVSGPKGAAGDDGADGAAGADYTADAELNALAGLTATTGLLVQTADNVFTTRNIAGTADKVVITNPAGVAGDPTISLGSKVVTTDTTATMAVGVTHTVYDHGSASGVSNITPLPSLGLLQKVSLAASATFTVNAPAAEEGCLILQITNTGAPTSVTFSSFDKTLLGDTFSLTINKVHWVYIWSIGTMQVMQIVNVA